ncbi:MAG: helix-hairpin-helix domain-containing protein [Candidatus Heimdallarchaeota archaeon]
MELTEVKGIGPATAIKLKTAGINTAEDLASASIEDVVSAGIRKPTATKIVNNAKEVVGTSSEPKKSEEKPKKAPKQTSKKPKAKEDKSDIRAVKIPISYVKGVGPKTRKILEEASIAFAQDLAKTEPDRLIELGIGKTTANKIISNAVEQVGVLPTAEKPSKKIEKKVEKKVEKEEKAKPVKPKKKKKEEPVTELERSPAPQGIPTKKKRGIQIRKTDYDAEEAPTEVIEKPAGWGVKAKELSEEEIARRKVRQDEIAKSRRITRPIPQIAVTVKAVKTETKEKGQKPEKVEKKKKKIKLSKKKGKVSVEFFTQTDIHPPISSSRKRGVSGKTGTSKPRILLERNTRLGKISSHRRSRRVINEKQLIVKLENGYKPDQLVGKKVYFIYPDKEQKVPGSISKRFGKASSGKVLVYFKKGIRREALNQPIFIK